MQSLLPKLLAQAIVGSQADQQSNQSRKQQVNVQEFPLTKDHSQQIAWGILHTVWSVTAVAEPSGLASGSEDRPGNVYITSISVVAVVEWKDYRLSPIRINKDASPCSAVNMGSVYYIDSRVKCWGRLYGG